MRERDKYVLGRGGWVETQTRKRDRYDRTEYSQPTDAECGIEDVVKLRERTSPDTGTEKELSVSTGQI